MPHAFDPPRGYVASANQRIVPADYPHPIYGAYSQGHRGIRLDQALGGAAKAAEFARLFLVPGVDHGFRGAGPTPQGTQAALIRWVEEGRAPDRLLGEVKDKDGKDVDELVIERRFVKTGPVRDGRVSIVSGIKDGDKVVTAGENKIDQGSKVVIDNSIALKLQDTSTIQ